MPDFAPRHVHWRGGIYRVCEDAGTYATAKAEGWVDHPPLGWPVPESYREWDGSELSAIEDEPPNPEPKKRGRPKKSPMPASEPAAIS